MAAQHFQKLLTMFPRPIFLRQRVCNEYCYYPARYESQGLPCTKVVYYGIEESARFVEDRSACNRRRGVGVR